jgi:hypothetical protein
MAQLLAALASDRPIGYSANLARVAGDAKAGLLLSQLLYWTRVGVDVEASGGWIVKSRDQWSHETGLSRCEQESARLVLLDAGLIEECRTGMPAKLAFRVRLSQVSAALATLLNAQPVQWSLFDVRSNADQVRALLGRSMAFYRVYSEITGSVIAAIFMARAMHAQRALAHGGGLSDWFTFSPGAWALETGLTAAQLRSSKQKMCQSEYISQAQMTYPKRRTVLRMRLSELTAAIVAHRLARINDGRPVGGLLGAIGRSTQASPQSARVKVPVSRPVSAQHTRPAKSHQQGNRMDSASKEGGSPEWRSVSAGYSSPLWRTTEETPEKLPEKASLRESTDLDGGISQAQSCVLPSSTPATCENPHAGFDTPVGGFSQPSWQLFARQMAGFSSPTCERAVFDYKRNDYNSSPNPPLSEAAQPASPTPGGGGGGGFFSQQPADQAPAPAPAHPADSTQHGGASASLIWPDLAPASLAAIQRIASEHRLAKRLPTDRLQLLIDELAAMAARGQVRVPTAYFSNLLTKEAEGTLDLATAYEWQARRELAKQAAQRGALPSAAKTSQQANTQSLLAKTSQQGDSRPALASAFAVQAKQSAAQPTPPIDPQAQATWTQCLHILQPRLGEQLLSLWLNPLVPVAMDATAFELVLLCGARFKLDHIKRAYLGLMDEALTQVMATPSAAPTTGWTCRLVTSFNR